MAGRNCGGIALAMLRSFWLIAKSMIRRAKIVAVVLGVAGPLLLLPAQFWAVAQPSHDQPRPVSEDQLRSFAKAYVKVEEIRESYEPRILMTQDPQKSRELEEEGISKIGEAIAHEGLTVESYSRIVRTANADEELRKKILDLINEQKTKS
jgi:hypothetical protein